MSLSRSQSRKGLPKRYSIMMSRAYIITKVYKPNVQMQILCTSWLNIEFYISLEEGYHLPPTYYISVPTPINVCMVLFAWVILPVLSYNPDLLDPILTDYFEAIADWQKTNVIKIFNFMLWVSALTCWC